MVARRWRSRLWLLLLQFILVSLASLVSGLGLVKREIGRSAEGTPARRATGTLSVADAVSAGWKAGRSSKHSSIPHLQGIGAPFSDNGRTLHIVKEPLKKYVNDSGIDVFLLFIPGNLSFIPGNLSRDELLEGFKAWNKQPYYKDRFHFSFFTWGNAQDWVFFIAFITLMLAIDMLVIAPDGKATARHATTCLVWFLFAVCYNFALYLQHGEVFALQWLGGYLLEVFLSMDNLFVMYLIFDKFRTPLALQRVALTVGIIVGISFRAVLFMSLGALIDSFAIIRVICGLMLVYSGARAVQYDTEDESDPSGTLPVRLLNLVFGDRIDTRYNDDSRLIYYEEKLGAYRITMITMIVVVIEISDALFSVDTVLAKVSQIGDVYLNLSSTALAMFALRSAFFIVQDMMRDFVLLKYGLCIILTFVGGELLVSPWSKLDPLVGVAVIASVFLICVLGSVAIARRQARERQLSSDSLKFECPSCNSASTPHPVSAISQPTPEATLRHFAPAPPAGPPRSAGTLILSGPPIGGRSPGSWGRSFSFPRPREPNGTPSSGPFRSPRGDPSPLGTPAGTPMAPFRPPWLRPDREV